MQLSVFVICFVTFSEFCIHPLLTQGCTVTYELIQWICVFHGCQLVQHSYLVHFVLDLGSAFLAFLSSYSLERRAPTLI